MHVKRSVSSPWARALVASTLVGVCACTATTPTPPDPAPSPTGSALPLADSGSEWAAPDPAPVLTGDQIDVPAGGATLDFEGVDVAVPGDASASTITVTEVEPIGARGSEWFGQPVHLEHAAPLTSPVTVSWDLPSDLTAEEVSTAFLVHYDPELRVWEATDEPVRIDGRTVRADLTDFSFWDVLVNIGQGAGELTGNRVPEPRCRGELPAWIDGVVDPDEDLSAAAIRTCFEPDQKEQVTVRVANNRTFTQRMTLTGGSQWAWTWKGQRSYDVGATAVDIARSIFDSRTTFLLPPVHEVAVGLARPRSAGSHVLMGTAAVDPVTALVDGSLGVLQGVSVGGTDNPALDAFLQAMYECGGKQALAKGDGMAGLSRDAAGLARFVVDSLGSCAEELVRPSSEFGARFEALLQRKIKAHPEITSSGWAKANRFTHAAANAFKVLTVGKLAIYGSDQFANATVGPLSWSVRGRGMNAAVGAWAPSCSSVADDSNQLYRNLALQDRYSDTSRELWEFESWPHDASVAVRPSLACDVGYRALLADEVSAGWADPVAASYVATAVRALESGRSGFGDGGTGTDAAGMLVTTTDTHSFRHPAWGDVTAVTQIVADPLYGGSNGEARIIVRDARDDIVWVHSSADSPPWYEIGFNDPASDTTGNVFINYNPGRYNGVIVLRGSRTGFSDFDSLPPPGEYDARWYFAEVVSDGGRLAIQTPDTVDCSTCGGGYRIVGHTIHAWQGRDYSD